LQGELAVAKEEKPADVPAIKQKIAAATLTAQALETEYQAAQ